MTRESSQTIELAELAKYRALIARLPVTLRPSLNGQLGEWETLFQYERQRASTFLRGLASFSAPALDALMLPLRTLEAKMGVDGWNFTQSSDTMENASLLARSEFYGEWREQVRIIYAAVESAAHTSTPPVQAPRLAVVILPAILPYDPAIVWRHWGDRGMPIRIDGDAASIPKLLVEGLPQATFSHPEDSSSFWLIDAELILQNLAPTALPNSSLSWTALRPLRDHVLERVNTVPRSIETTDRTLATIRSEDMGFYWPQNLSANPQLKRFLIDLYLSGNGALIFSNAFVQWAATEALRRARPRVLVARFGLRARPKPFTGIAIFENQQRISSLPDVDDPQGSAVDALILARYIRMSVDRFPEGEQTAFLAVSESAQTAFLSLPGSSASALRGKTKATAQDLAQGLQEFLAGRSG